MYILYLNVKLCQIEFSYAVTYLVIVNLIRYISTPNVVIDDVDRVLNTLQLMVYVSEP